MSRGSRQRRFDVCAELTNATPVPLKVAAHAITFQSNRRSFVKRPEIFLARRLHTANAVNESGLAGLDRTSRVRSCWCKCAGPVQSFTRYDQYDHCIRSLFMAAGRPRAR